jgi:hypothetical protein
MAKDKIFFKRSELLLKLLILLALVSAPEKSEAPDTPRIERKAYIGHSAYAEMDSSGALILTTWNGNDPRNRIILEPETMANLKMFLDRLETKTK